MVRSLTVVSLWISLLYGGELTPIKSISLHKDQTEHLIVKSELLQKHLLFRWTLFRDNALVILRSYDTIVAQHTLYLKQSNRSFRVTLFGARKAHEVAPYLVITFKRFDYQSKQAFFDIYLSDDNERVRLEFI